MYKTRSKFFQSFGFPHRLKKKKFKFTRPASPGGYNRKSRWASSQFKSPRPEWLDEFYNKFHEYKKLKNKWEQTQKPENSRQKSENSFKKDVRNFDFKGLKQLCNKYLDLLDKEVRIAQTDRAEVHFDKQRKKMKYELYQMNQLLKQLRR